MIIDNIDKVYCYMGNLTYGHKNIKTIEVRWEGGNAMELITNDGKKIHIINMACEVIGK